MEHQLLNKFNNDQALKDTVLAYCKSYFEQEIVNKAYKGEDVRPMAEAVKALENAFHELSSMFIPKNNPHEQKNVYK